MKMSIPQGILAAFLLATCVAVVARGETWTDPNTGYTWTYEVLFDDNGEETASIFGSWNWSGENGYLFAISVTPSPTGFLTIPAAIGGKKLSSIGGYAFSGCQDLTGVTIPQGVKSIGENAFAGCNGLTSMIIPGCVKSIGEGAFGDCAGLTTVTILEGVESILGGAFNQCVELKHVLIPNSVTTIGVGAFSGSGLESVTIPGSVASIGNYAFSYCGLKSVTIQSGVTAIGEEAFSNCSNLKSVTIPGSVTTIERWAFINCPSLEVVTMSEGVVSIGLEAFGGCSSLTKLTFPNSVARIGEGAFLDCAGLRSITLPPSLMQIGSRAFEECVALHEVIFEGSAPDVGENIYQGTTNSLVSYVRAGSIGWAGGISTDLPELWNERPIAYIGGSPGSGATQGGGAQSVVTNCVSVTTTNVVVHYLLTGAVQDVSVPANGDTGFVTVVSEIKGGAVAIPESWATNYPAFSAKFGSDFTSALTKPTGKRDSQGNALQVWHDYVAGTDPTREEDVFRASIIMVDGEPVIGYTPILTGSEKARRKYTIYGKARLQDENWQIVDGNAGDYNFFKVTVEMSQ